MKYSLIFILIVIFKIHSTAQVVVDPKGTRFSIDTSQWKKSGNDIYNKNNGKIGIGTSTPSAQLHTTGDVRFAGIGTSNSNSKILTSDASGNITTRLVSEILSTYTGRILVTLTSDVVANSTTLTDIPDLSFNVTAGITYRFFAIVPFISSDQTNGSRWTINGPATTFLSYTSRYTISSINETYNFLNSYNAPNTANNNSNASGNLAIIQGIITPSANGTVRVRFASELAAPSSITAKAGATLEYW
jgi:hypothetical protein